jgi:hypothetical protein
VTVSRLLADLELVSLLIEASCARVELEAMKTPMAKAERTATTNLPCSNDFMLCSPTSVLTKELESGVARDHG